MSEKKTSGPVTVTIAIENGMVKCEPACAYVRPGESIIWECPAGFPYAIHLGYGSPFKKVHHQKPGRERIELSIPQGTHHARVKYTVAVFDGTNVWIEDPEVIIRPEY
jgi:hypothetical protein